MIRITNKEMITENCEELLGFFGGENDNQRNFLIEDLTLQNRMIFRAYLQFDDGTCDFFTLNASQEQNGVKLVWNITDNHIHKSGLIKLKIKCFVGDNELFCTPVGKFIASNSFEIDRQADIVLENSEIADIERKLNLIQLASQKPPIIAQNGNWLLYNYQADEYQDSHLPSKGDKGDKGDTGECGVNIIEQNSIELAMLDQNLRNMLDNMVSQELYIPEKRAILSAIQTSNQNLSDLSDKLSELSDIAIKYKNSNNVVTSWEDVQRIVRAGLAQDVFEIGEQLVCNHATYGTMVWNIIGIDQENVDGTDYNHSLTLQLDRIISNNIAFKAFDSTGVTNSWEISQIRDWLNGTFFDGLDSDFKSVVAQTTKITGDTQTQDKMFLLSKQEAGTSGYKFYQEDNRNRLFARGSYWILRTSAGVERTNGWLLVDLVLNYNYITQTIGNTAVQSPRGIVPACCIM